jgi:hypothetical protein
VPPQPALCQLAKRRVFCDYAVIREGCYTKLVNYLFGVIMKNRKGEVIPFYKPMMQVGAFLALAAFGLNPQGEVHFLGLYWPIHGLMYMLAVALFFFGFSFGVFAAISARRANTRRMQQEAAEAADADKLSDSQSDDVFTKPAPAASTSSAYASPEPRVVVLDKVSKPNLEFPTS